MSKRYRRLCACNTSLPCFAKIGETTPTHCALCKTDSMVSLHKKCTCGLKQPCFDYLGIKPPKYCASCKLENMVNVKDKLCQCNSTQPSYNFPNETKAICVPQKRLTNPFQQRLAGPVRHFKSFYAIAVSRPRPGLFAFLPQIR